jgi:streptogramin lyase
MENRQKLLGLAATLALASCNGGNSVPAAPVGAAASAIAATSANPAASAGRAQLELAVKIPRPSRVPKYVSPSTESLTIYEGSTKLRTFNTTPTTNNCQQSAGATLCRFSMGVFPGTGEVFKIDTFDDKNATGKLLASGSVKQTIVVGRNTIPITLRGIVTSLSVSLVGPNPPAGTASQARVLVTAKDPDGNIIIAPGQYNVNVTLSNSDTSGATKLSQYRVLGPSTIVNLSYDGASLSQAVIGASAPGVAADDVVPAVFTPEPTILGSYQLPHGYHGDSLAPVAIATGPDSNVWFSVCCDPHGIVQMTPSGMMTFYRAGVPPSHNLPNRPIVGLAAGSDGNVWYAAGRNIGSITPTGSVKNYSFSGGGLCIAATALHVVPAAGGGLWISTSCLLSPHLRVAYVTTAGTIKSYSLNTAFASDSGMMVLGHDGNLYFAGEDIKSRMGAIDKAVVSGNAITSDSFARVRGTFSLFGIAQAEDGDFWVTNDGCNPSLIARLHPDASFPASKSDTFKTLAGCARPTGIVAVNGNNLWFADHNYAVVSRIVAAPYPAPPVLRDVPIPTPSTVPGRTWSVTVGPNGDLYFTNLGFGSKGSSSNIIRMAY